MKRSIVVVGSSNTDMILKLERIPRPGETLLGGVFHMVQGGKGANQAVAASKCGGEVSFVAKVGNDSFGTSAMSGLKESGIDTGNILRDGKESSGIALIFVDTKGENAIGVAPGSNANLSVKDIQSVDERIARAKILLLQLEIPLETIQAAVNIAYQHNVDIILNPAPSQRLPKELLQKITILTPNVTEAEHLTGIAIKTENDLHRCAQNLLESGVRNVIITLGIKGAFIATKTIREIIPSFKVEAIDSTAAGDVFNGALAVELSNGQDLKDAVRFANAAAAISVTRLGAQTSIPSRDEVEKMLSKQLTNAIQ